ncbi:MAG: hypothetical protein ACJ77B_12165 [Chloroflexota bacterium]
MSPGSVVAWIVGLVLVSIGYRLAKGPWDRYQALREQDANEARYGAWRGGIRDTSTTGASVAMQILRRQAQRGAIVGAVGVVLIFLGFAIR